MNTEELLSAGLNELKIPCSDVQRSAFLLYLRELKKWNKTYNLTGLKTDKDIIIKHFLDSLLYLRVVPDRVGKLADAGSGAGFPGLPIKIIRPETAITLVEPSRKKAAFLRHMTRLLGLEGVDILQKRMEGLGPEYENYFDVIVSRATFSIVEFIELGCPYVRDRGYLVLNKGPGVDRELGELERKPYGRSALREVIELRLPIIGDTRNLVVLECKTVM